MNTKFALILISSFVIQASSFSAQPNLVVILVDDMGYSDLSCYGSEIPTPNIDALAKGSTRFRNFYNCAQCCPTRASLISGMYPHEAGVGDMIDKHSLAVRTAANSPRYSDRRTIIPSSALGLDGVVAPSNRITVRLIVPGAAGARAHSLQS